MTAVTPEQLFQVKQQLQTEIDQQSRLLAEVREKQTQVKSIEALAELVLEYNRIENAISDRGYVLTFLSSPLEKIRSPFVKSQIFSYIEAAETVGPDLVNVIIDYLLEALRNDIQEGEEDAVDLIQAQYREYILPGKVVAERFEEIDELLSEMNRYCAAVDPNYNKEQARDVLVYAFEVSITSDTRMEPTITALKEKQFEYLTPEDRAGLLDKITEHMAVLRFEEARTQNIAMDKAVKMMEEREQEQS